MSQNTDPNLRLSPHFTFGEAMASYEAERRGIDNTPPISAIAPLIRIAEHILEPIRTQYGRPFSPTSWYRCLALNRALNSKDDSQHVKGQAVDIKVPGVPMSDLFEFIAATLDFDQLILEHWSPDNPHFGWVHVSYVSAVENRHEILRYDGQRYLRGVS